MPNIKDAFQKINKTHLTIAGVLLLVLFAVFLLWFNNNNSMLAGSTVNIELHFEGEYRIADGPWKPYVAGEHIPATKGDVTLRGNLYKSYEGEDLGVYNSEDMPVAFYTNHINLTFYEIDETGEKYYLVSECENPQFGDSNCGKSWVAHQFMSDRLLRRAARRPHEAGSAAKVERCKQMLEELLPQVDTLLF